MNVAVDIRDHTIANLLIKPLFRTLIPVYFFPIMKSVGQMRRNPTWLCVKITPPFCSAVISYDPSPCRINIPFSIRTAPDTSSGLARFISGDHDCLQIQPASLGNIDASACVGSVSINLSTNKLNSVTGTLIIFSDTDAAALFHCGIVADFAAVHNKIAGLSDKNTTAAASWKRMSTCHIFTDQSIIQDNTAVFNIDAATICIITIHS